MSHRPLVLAVVCALFAFVFWSGYQNRRERESAAPPPTQPFVGGRSNLGPQPDLPLETFVSPLTGKPAPEFRLHDLGGHQVSLADYRGKAVLINFWATWCAPCTVEMPWFITLRQQYAAQGFEVLGIDKDFPEDVPKVPAFAKKMGLNYPVLYGDTRAYASFQCCDYLPTSYYVDRSGRIQVATVGLGTRDEVDANIRKVLSR